MSQAWTPSFVTPPPPVRFESDVLITYPLPHVVLVTLNRPQKLNTFFVELSVKLSKFMDWADKEPEIWCAIITGNGRAFSCGGDLEAWLQATMDGKGGLTDTSMNKTGAAGLSRRISTIPIIAAVNGLCIGGGMEIMINCDLVVASEKAIFALPEVKRGICAYLPIASGNTSMLIYVACYVYVKDASQGALPRLVRSIGRQRASEIAILGLPISASQALSWGLVNKVVPPAEVLSSALAWALEITKNSPDGVKLTKMSFNAAQEYASLEGAVDQVNLSKESVELSSGENAEEGMNSFVERREPRWVNSKL